MVRQRKRIANRIVLSILSNLENLEFMADIYTLKRERAAQRIDEGIDRYQLGEFLTQHASTLSGGQNTPLAPALPTRALTR